MISNSCIKDSLRDRVLKGGLNGGTDRAILGGVIVKILLIRVVNCGYAILGWLVLDRGFTAETQRSQRKD